MRNTLVINLDRCTGCEACITACKFENGLPLGERYNRVTPVGPTGTFPKVEQYWVPFQCQQCENAACEAVCPTGATYRDPDTGVVLVTQETCIGCQSCIIACPYGARSMHEETNTAQKCTLCSHISFDGESLPACVHNCCTGARFFGDLDDPDSDASKELAKYPEESIFHLPDENDARPTTRYILSSRLAAWKDRY